MNYDKKKNDFVAVRESTGGGTRTVAFPNTANGNYILSTCKELFFPEGFSKFGTLSNMDVKLGNFKREVIEDVHAFNLVNYIKANKLTKTRFYIMKKLSPSQLINSMSSTVNVSDSDEDSDDSFLDFIYSDRTIRCEPCTEVVTVHQSPSNDLPRNNLAEYSPITPELSISQLTGSSTERTKLLSEIDQAYQEYLKADQLKGNYEKEQGQLKPSSTIPNFEQAQRIRFIRQTRVVPEPEIYQESIVASVRHVTLGLIRRSFPKASMMNVVYDWVGSLSEFPVFFNFLQNQGQPFSHICQ